MDARLRSARRRARDGYERRAVALARADRARGIEPVPLDEVVREFDSTLDPPTSDRHQAMTAKEKLRVRVEDLTEQEAEATLDFIASRGASFADWLDARPEDDEPLTPRTTRRSPRATPTSPPDERPPTSRSSTTWTTSRVSAGRRCASRAPPRRICVASIRQSARAFSPAWIVSSPRIARSM